MENFSKASKILFSQDGNVISLFNGTNYDEWSEDCRLVLVRKNLWGIFTQMEPEPTSENDKLKYAADHRRHMRLLHSQLPDLIETALGNWVMIAVILHSPGMLYLKGFRG